ncbi:TPA: helix-turn-helix transcriptional regulator [Klebsiella pneumoniae]|nr:helix-turn-helix transcriptional regulator [Klebsiella pneumoniae]
MNDILSMTEEYMITNNITRYHLCKLTGMNTPALYNVFNRKTTPELKTIQRYLDALNLTIILKEKEQC